MAWGWLKNKKTPYLGGGDRPSTIKSPTLKEGWGNIKSELGKAFDFLGEKKKKKKDEYGSDD